MKKNITTAIIKEVKQYACVRRKFDKLKRNQLSAKWELVYAASKRKYNDHLMKPMREYIKRCRSMTHIHSENDAQSHNNKPHSYL